MAESSTSSALLTLLIRRYPETNTTPYYYQVQVGEVPSSYPGKDFGVEWKVDPPTADFTIEKVWPSADFKGSVTIMSGGKSATGRILTRKLPLSYKLRVRDAEGTCMVYGGPPSPLVSCQDHRLVGPSPPPKVIIDALGATSKAANADPEAGEFVSNTTDVQRKRTRACGTHYEARKLRVHKSGNRTVVWTVEPRDAAFTFHEVGPASRFRTVANLGHTLVAEVTPGESGEVPYTLYVKDGRGRYCKVFAGRPTTCDDCRPEAPRAQESPPKPPPKVIIDGD